MSSDPLSQIARLSARMAWLVTAAFWLLPPGLVLYVLLIPEQLTRHPAVASAGLAAGSLSPVASAAVIGALLIMSAPILWGLWELKKLFEGFAAGAVFTVSAARRLRRCGTAVLLASLRTVVGAVLLSAALSLDQPAGAKALVVSFSSDDIGFLLIGGILLVIARVMEEAARIATENAAFI